MIMAGYQLRALGRTLAAHPWGCLCALVACTLAAFQFTITVHAVDVISKASLIPVSASSMMAYLKGRPATAAQDSVRQALKRIPGVAHVIYIPPKEGLARMEKWLGPDSPLVDDLDPEILPAAFEVRLDRQSLGRAEQIAGQVRAIAGVDDVRYNQGLMGQIAASYAGIRQAGIATLCLVSLTLGLIVFLTVRLAVLAHEPAIAVLDVLGAGRGFLYGPYIGLALLLGCVSGVLGAGLAFLAVQEFTLNVNLLKGVLTPLSLPTAGLSTGFTVLASLLGAGLAIIRR